MKHLLLISAMAASLAGAAHADALSPVGPTVDKLAKLATTQPENFDEGELAAPFGYFGFTPMTPACRKRWGTQGTVEVAQREAFYPCFVTSILIPEKQQARVTWGELDLAKLEPGLRKAFSSPTMSDVGFAVAVYPDRTWTLYGGVYASGLLSFELVMRGQPGPAPVKAQPTIAAAMAVWDRYFVSFEKAVTADHGDCKKMAADVDAVPTPPELTASLRVLEHGTPPPAFHDHQEQVLLKLFSALGDCAHNRDLMNALGRLGSP